MTTTVTPDAIRQQTQSTAAAGRVFPLSLRRIPRVSAESRARLEAAARAPENTRRDYPQLIVE